MENPERYHHLRVDWVGKSSTRSIMLCGVKGEDMGTGPMLCPHCAQVDAALHLCGLGPERLRELFDTLRVVDPARLNAQIEQLYAAGAILDAQDRSELN